MGIEIINGDRQQLPLPKCNGCGERPLPLIAHNIDAPDEMILRIICCAICGHTITVFPIGMKEPEIEKPKIITRRN
jgi:hypothetical protein